MPISLKANSDGSAEILNGVNKVLDISQDGWLGGKNIQGYNYIINGNFDIWQRGTSQTTNGYGSDDRWLNNNINAPKVHSRQEFAVGQTFPDGAVCPNYYSRTVVSSVVGADNYIMKQHKIESVKTLAGKKAILSFYAKADTSKNMSIECLQNFGGGSEHVFGIGVQKLVLSSVWTRFVISFTIPSIYGKTIGSTSLDCLAFQFWFDAGSNFNSRTDNLGHQSGTFDIAAVSLVEGDVDVKPIPRSYGEELALCQRYYWRGLPCSSLNFSFYTAGCIASVPVLFPAEMRAFPTMSVNTPGKIYESGLGTETVGEVSRSGYRLLFTSASAAQNATVAYNLNTDWHAADAEL